MEPTAAQMCHDKLHFTDSPPNWRTSGTFIICTFS